jgi:hypothetical protein
MAGPSDYVSISHFWLMVVFPYCCGRCPCQRRAHLLNCTHNNNTLRKCVDYIRTPHSGMTDSVVDKGLRRVRCLSKLLKV